MHFRPNSSELSKNNARNITCMAVFIFRKFFDFEQVSADSEMPIPGQPPGIGWNYGSWQECCENRHGCQYYCKKYLIN